MEIEIYKIEEVTGELGEMAADSTAAELIQSLGLDGQKKLLNAKTETRVAFRRMTVVEMEVYQLLFPERSNVLKFETEIIPIRILEILKTAIDLKHFVKIEVWHSRTKKEDPVLVGITGESRPQTWDADYVVPSGHFLIARWGEALLPFEKLCEQAKKLWILNQKIELDRTIREKQRELESVALEAERKFSTI